MLYNKNDAQSYEKEFKKRFTNFCEKSPILISFTITPNYVQIINEAIEDENVEAGINFSWDYSLNVKEFIHAIKEVLVKRWYPVIIKEDITKSKMSIEEQTEMIERGVPIDKVPTEKTHSTTTQFIIDKVIVYRDIFILKEVQSSNSYRFKFNKSSVFFLKKIRNGVLNSIEAGKFFFDNATLMNTIE